MSVAAACNDYHRLTRSDLRSFDPDSTKLILKAMDAGATGRVSARGHAILRGADGATAAVARNLTKRSRGARNARADVDRLIAGIRKSTPPRKNMVFPIEQRVITVSEGFEKWLGFSTWYDHLEGDVPNDARVRVTWGDGHEPVFVLLNEVPQHVCQSCNKSFRTEAALHGHAQTHATRVMVCDGLTIRAVMRANNMSDNGVRNRLRKRGLHAEDGAIILSCDSLRKAGLKVPGVNEMDAFSQSGMESESADRPGETRDGQSGNDSASVDVGESVDVSAGSHVAGVGSGGAGTEAAGEGYAPAGVEGAAVNATQSPPAPVVPEVGGEDAQAILQRVRDALGADPRITQLEQEVKELRAELAAEHAECEELKARLQLVHDALGA